MRPEPMVVVPVILTGSVVRLEPLTMRHLPELSLAARHDEIWTYLDEATPVSEAPMAEMIEEALVQQERGERVPFAIVELSDGRTIGTISYIDIARSHRGLEIGWAWVTPARWRTGAGREAARLLLAHAFDTVGAIRVVFKTDSRNERSQRAIESIGATREGVFRNHRILRDGHVRHSVFYSVIDSDWPSLRSDIAPSA